MAHDERPAALILTDGQYGAVYAKTAHGLVRGPCRYRVAAVVDAPLAGRDAGEILDGRARGIPVVADVGAALEREPAIDHAVVGVATKGGVLSDSLRAELLVAADAGLTLVNGLHRPLADDREIAARARAAGGSILDLRRPPPLAALRFWTGDVLDLATPRLPVLGTDCAMGKRTTCGLLRRALAERSVRAEVVYTGQTGWLQGYRHGFILDATPNDFVPGQLEGAVLDCAREASPDLPDLILVEGQASLRNPSGPCGSEMIVSLGARGVVLMHAPARKHFKGFEARGIAIPPLDEEIALIRALGAEVWAIGLHEDGLDGNRAETERRTIEAAVGVPCTRPLADGGAALAEIVRRRLGEVGEVGEVGETGEDAT